MPKMNTKRFSRTHFLENMHPTFSTITLFQKQKKKAETKEIYRVSSF